MLRQKLEMGFQKFKNSNFKFQIQRISNFLGSRIRGKRLAGCAQGELRNLCHACQDHDREDRGREEDDAEEDDAEEGDGEEGDGEEGDGEEGDVEEGDFEGRPATGHD